MRDQVVRAGVRLDERHGVLRRHRLHVAGIGALLDDRPRAVLRQNQRTARGAHEHALAGCVGGGIDVDPRQPHPLLRLRDVDRAVDRAAERSVLESQQIGKDPRRNQDRRRLELDVAEHLARLDDDVGSRADAAADHVVEMHVRVEDDGLQVHVERVVQARWRWRRPAATRAQRQPLELRRKVRVVEGERRREGTAVRKVANLAHVRDAFDRLVVKFVRLGNRLSLPASSGRACSRSCRSRRSRPSIPSRIGTRSRCSSASA